MKPQRIVEAVAEFKALLKEVRIERQELIATLNLLGEYIQEVKRLQGNASAPSRDAADETPNIEKLV